METLSLLFINYIHLVKYSMLQRLLHYVYDNISVLYFTLKSLFIGLYIGTTYKYTSNNQKKQYYSQIGILDAFIIAPSKTSGNPYIYHSTQAGHQPES